MRTYTVTLTTDPDVPPDLNGLMGNYKEINIDHNHRKFSSSTLFPLICGVDVR